MRNRKFGVEIECGFRDNTATNYNEAVGLMSEEVKKGNIGEEWLNHTADGTLIEFRSPILQGTTGFEELAHVMKLIKANGGHVTNRDGMHVHHDAPDFIKDDDALQRLIVAWKTNEDTIYKFVPPERRYKGVCPALPPNMIVEVEKDPKNVNNYKQNPYHGRFDLNIRALAKHGSIEIRLHQGCLDPLAAEAWIRFGQAFLNRAVLVHKPVGKVQSHEELLDRIRAHATSRKHLLVHA